MSNLVENLLENALFLAAAVDKPAARSLNVLEAAEVFLEAGLNSRGEEILAGALTVIETIKLPSERVTRLAWAAALYARAGNIRYAHQVFERAILLARAVSDEEKIKALADIAGEYSDVEFRDEGLPLLAELENLVPGMQSEAEKSHQFTLLADLYAEFEQVDKAKALLESSLRSSRSIRDNWFKAERTVEAAESYSQLREEEKSAAALQEAWQISQRIEPANRPYFLFGILDIYLDLGVRIRVLELLTELRGIIEQDPSTFSRAGGLIELAERYHEAGLDDQALEFLAAARETAEKAESDSDRVTGFTRAAALLGRLGRTPEALELAEKAFLLCGNLKNERTHIYLLGDISLVFLELDARGETARCVMRILEIVAASEVRTLGLGEIAGELAEGGQIALAVRLAGNIREAEVKSGALCTIASALVSLGREPDEEIELAVREMSDGTSSQRGLF